MTYAGKSITGAPSFRLVREGLVLVPEGRGIFGQLTVAENLAMGAFARNDSAEVKRDLDRTLALFPRLAERSAQTAGTLSGGEQQMLALGRALMSKPRLLLLDEPSMGLAPLMVVKIFEVVRRIASEGVTILLVEQNARLALEAASRGYVMESGAITLAGEAGNCWPIRACARRTSAKRPPEEMYWYRYTNGRESRAGACLCD